MTEARSTHDEWIKFLLAYPDYKTSPDPAESVGDVAHHTRVIVGYDHVLRVLESYRSMIV